MKSLLLSVTLLTALATPTPVWAWTSFLDGQALPQTQGWVASASDPGLILDLGGGNSGIKSVDSSASQSSSWSWVLTRPEATLGARFRIDSYVDGPVNLLQARVQGASDNLSPFVAVGIRQGRFVLLRVLADRDGSPGETAHLADLGAVDLNAFHEAYLYVDNTGDRVRLFWDGALHYTGTETDSGFLFGNSTGLVEFGASASWPDNNPTGICTATFDWVGLGDGSDLPLKLPFIPWTQRLDGDLAPERPWEVFNGGESGATEVVTVTDPTTGREIQALQLNSGSGAHEYYVGSFQQDEVFGGARFAVMDVSPTGKENLLCIVTRSQPRSPAPSITLVDGRYTLWSYVDPDSPGSPGFLIHDLGPVVPDEWHTAYLYANKDGRVILWWDGAVAFDALVPLVNPFDGYFEWGSGSWQFDAVDTVLFDWVAYGARSPLTTEPTHRSAFVDPAAGLTFTYTTEDEVSPSAFKIAVNGVDQTSRLVLTRNGADWMGSLDGLIGDQAYRVTLAVTAFSGHTSTYTVDFDTFSQGNFMFEAEDWNVDGGMYYSQPVLSSAPVEGSYFGATSVEGVDHLDLSTDPGASPHPYRTEVLVGTEVTGDMVRQKYLEAQEIDAAIVDYNLHRTEPTEWLNYTRDFPPGNYYVYGRFASGQLNEPFEASLSRVLGATTTEQIASPLGIFRGGPGEAWQLYSTIPLTDRDGNRIVVALDGITTLRVTCLEGSYNANFYMLVSAGETPPRLNLLRSGAEVTVSWAEPDWKLESSANLAGPWILTPNQVNNQVISPVGQAQFYRLRR